MVRLAAITRFLDAGLILQAQVQTDTVRSRLIKRNGIFIVSLGGFIMAVLLKETFTIENGR